MKRLIATAVLAAALASSALAQQQTAPPPNQPIVQEPPATLGQGVRQPSEPVLPPQSEYWGLRFKGKSDRCRPGPPDS